LSTYHVLSEKRMVNMTMKPQRMAADARYLMPRSMPEITEMVASKVMVAMMT
jgi:hypothetical protein